ncbi:hypothetical protein N657DRAFT_640144 [Parathielavia appendiculata]|uniref:Uncharacterized protein n=1 Tax=Parathielavia appendiculata TaxID=2587402 RepID=A0AAN6UBJ6_9PEZI|nr:hypothetical protein N657DRAFT_640144 [Parathielavia appendiculata]
MCLIGLLLPVNHREKPRKHRSRYSCHKCSEHSYREKDETKISEHRHGERSHRRGEKEMKGSGRQYRERSHRLVKDETSDLERPQRERSHRREEGETRNSERSYRERRSLREKDETRASAVVAEEALARLCLTLEQSLLEEQRRWRYQDRLDRLERQRLGLEGEPTRSEAAPPYSLRDENPRPPTAEPQYETGMSGSPGRCNRESAICCRSCVCTRCGSANLKCPTVPELDDTQASSLFEIGAEPPRRRIGTVGRPISA